MGARTLSSKEISELEDRLGQVLLGLSQTEGEFDVDAEYQELMFSKTNPDEAAYAEIREMSKRFGPRLVQILGFPPAPGTCKLSVSEDCITVRADIEPPSGEGAPVTADDILRLLEEQNIVFGIDEDAIEKAAKTGHTSDVKGVCVARGTRVQQGRDGHIEPIKHWEPAPAGMKIPASDGNIRVSDVDTVAKGQKIAKLAPPAEGVPGKDVFGRDIPARSGRPIVPEVGENVSFDAHAGYFYATAPGRVVIHENSIEVESLMKFDRDVDISVGHVMFQGEILIRGSVRSGLWVQAEKDIVIEGGVEAAQVRSLNGSIVIGKGVQGSGMAMIQAAWDITTRFVEQATVLAGGVLTTESAYRSELAGGTEVLVTKGKGVVIGGKIYAGQRVEVRDLGAGTGEPTVVQLGITPENLMDLSKLKTRLQAARKALDESELAIMKFGLTSETLRAQAMTEEGKQLLKLAKTVVVLHNRLRKIEEEEYSFLESMKSRVHGMLDDRGRVYPGVKVLIGHLSYLVGDALSCVRFKFDPKQHRIKAIPLI